MRKTFKSKRVIWCSFLCVELLEEEGNEVKLSTANLKTFFTLSGYGFPLVIIV